MYKAQTTTVHSRSASSAFHPHGKSCFFLAVIWLRARTARLTWWNLELAEILRREWRSLRSPPLVTRPVPLRHLSPLLLFQSIKEGKGRRKGGFVPFVVNVLFLFA